VGANPWWAWLLPILFGAPWLAAIAWVWFRSPSKSGEAPPSLAELIQQRLWLR
jgi:hypothetical protein